MPNGRSSTDASSAFGSCDSMYNDDSDDEDCQVVEVRPPPRTAAAAVSPATSQKSQNSSWSTWDVKASGKRPSMQHRPRGEAKGRNGHVGPELVDDNQQSLRREWEAATLRRRTCPPMRSEGSKAGTNGHWGAYQAPQSASVHRETDVDSGTAETVQSNGHVSPVKVGHDGHVSLHTLSESTSTSADSVFQVAAVEPREDGDAEPDEVASRSKKRTAPAPAPATDDQVLPEYSSNSVFRSREDPPLNMESPPKFARASCSTDVKNGSKGRYAPDVHAASPTQMKPHMNGTDGASISGHGGINSLKHMDIGAQSTRDGVGINSWKHMDNGDVNTREAGGSEPAFDHTVGQDLVGAREKLKETADFKLADQEEWARRQQELQKQVSPRNLWSSRIGSLLFDERPLQFRDSFYLLL